MKGNEHINIALMGDSRVRNLYEFFEFMFKGSFTPWAEKPHRNLESKYPDFNVNIDFLWGPQMETGNQEVFEKTSFCLRITIIKLNWQCIYEVHFQFPLALLVIWSS